MTTMKNSGQRPEHRYSAGMTSSPLPPDHIRAAAAVHHELGPEYSDAVIESFLEKIDQEIAARIERQLASLPQERLRQPEPARLAKARTMLAGAAVGAITAGLPLTLLAWNHIGGLGPHGELADIWLILVAIAAAVVFSVGAVRFPQRAKKR
jgi:hypothetical protein